ncbi:MAG TPA: DUF2330 domain-containing protein [Polyangiaceae bacterium]|nr:DUF2330 domain-containing protein [Polyangiaceae bacterium]
MKLRIGIMLAAVSFALGGEMYAADASACGMFVPRNLEETIPTIRQEQVLIVYDQKQQLQHFVREVSFDAGNGEFGFIVPTPKQPEVAAAKSPFAELRKAYPFEPPHQFEGGPPGSRGMKGASGGGAAPVQVLSVQRVGKFTAFVLAATDAGALGKWLTDNKFQAPPKAKGWLDHYVALGFYYVAFRYDPPKDKKATGLTSETVRISFKTPYPYYPYQEPGSARSADSRLLSLWFLSQSRMKPIAAKARLASVQHVRPWTSGLSYDVSAKELAGKLGGLSKLVPAGGKLVLQTYRDLKTSRTHWGDVLLVPSTPQKLSSEQIAERRWLFPVLDPLLMPEAGGAK